MKYDLKIINAIIVDGRGTSRYEGNIGITAGKIVAIGKVDGAADAEIDAAGAVVSPGFIDCHTHFDAQVMWDDMLSPSVYHGVTTVLCGNCGFTLAPLSGRQADTDYMLAMLSRVEGMPLSSLTAAVTPTWQSFGEYLDAIDGKLAINTAFMVGHSALRRCVMGERAVGHEATIEEIEAMANLLRLSLAAGGTGFSTSVSHTHTDHDGEPVPSRWASESELLSLAGVLRDYPGTWLELIHGQQRFGEREYDLLTRMSLCAERPLNWNAVAIDANHVTELNTQMRMGRYAAERGARVYGLAPAMPTKTITNFRTGIQLELLEGWKDFSRLPPEQKKAAMRDPSVRARLQQTSEVAFRLVGMSKDFGAYMIDALRLPANARWVGRLVKDYAAEVGLSPFDALFALAVEEDLWMSFSPPPFGASEASWNLRSEVWRDEFCILGGSDAGAHLDTINTFALSTHLLGEAVRRRKLLSLEEAVQQLTSVIADAFGITGRGRIDVGAAADLVVFDPDTIDCAPIVTRHDLPEGEMRLYADAIGVHHVIVNGVPVAANNAPSGRKGGRVLRSGQDTATVALA